MGVAHTSTQAVVSEHSYESLKSLTQNFKPSKATSSNKTATMGKEKTHVNVVVRRKPDSEGGGDPVDPRRGPQLPLQGHRGPSRGCPLRLVRYQTPRQRPGSKEHRVTGP